MKQRRIPILVAAAAASVILLLMIFWPGLSSRMGSGSVPGVGRGEVARTPADVVQPAESTTVHRFGTPDEWCVAGAVGQTYTETLSGVGLRIGETSVLLGQSPPDGPYIDWYAIGRAYAGWDTSSLPDSGEVLSATLVLELLVGGGREEPLDITIYQGGWTLPIGLEDWQTPGSRAVGQWHLPASGVEGREKLLTGQDIVLYASEPAQVVRISLDPAVVESGGVTRLELRYAQEGIASPSAEIVPLGPSQIKLEVEYRP